jgi:F0F1-type ATP synthase assembly protein I
MTNQDKNLWRDGLVIFARLSGWVVGPVIIALLLGKWIDRKYQTDPWGTLVCVLFFFIISSVGIVQESMKEMKRIEEEENFNKK